MGFYVCGELHGFRFWGVGFARFIEVLEGPWFFRVRYARHPKKGKHLLAKLSGLGFRDRRGF